MLFERKVLHSIRKYYNTPDIIVIHSARQTGKTSLLKIIMGELNNETCVYFDLEDSRFKNLLEKGPDAVINYLKQKELMNGNGKVYLFIDEIQYLNNPSSFLKLMHDHHPEIKMIVSGSSSFEIKSKFKDSLVGRTVNFELYQLDFEEFLHFKNQHFDLYQPDKELIVNETLKLLYIEYVQFGGYPKVVLTDEEELKEKYLQQIIDTYIKNDIRDLARIRHIEKFNKLITVLAGQSGQLLNITELFNTTHISRLTIEEYLFILENTYILKLINPFSGNMRSELFKTPKVYFYDTGIMNMLASTYIPKVIDGTALETAVFSDLIKNFGKNRINFWRTTDKKEIDFILKIDNRPVPVEVKLNAGRFRYTAFNYFSEKYNIKNGYCIALEGKLPRQNENLTQIYPWDLYSTLI